MPDVKWIKITTDIFDDEKILLIESLPEADSIIVIWFKLLCLAGKMNNSGVFMMNDRVAYTDKMLATIFRRKETTVQIALKTFEDFGMIEIIDGVITIPKWCKHQSLDRLEKRNEYMKNYMRKQREKQRLLTVKTNCEVNSKVNVNCAEEEKEKERDLEKEKIKYNVVVDDYNRICSNLPNVTALSDARKKAIKARINKYGCDGVMKAFQKASESDFLNGTNGRNWRANFDWIMKDANMAKILDGNYDNRGQAEGGDYFSRNGIDDPLKDLDIDFSEG